MIRCSYRRCVTALATALLLLIVVAPAVAQEPLTVNVDGVQRRAIVFAPQPNGARAPVVFVFHGAGDTAANFAGVGFQQAWPEAVVVYMDGLGRAPGQGGAFQTTDAGPDNRDLKFFDAALAAIRSRMVIDPGRIYATGFSNGAKFVYLLWATRPQLFAAFAPVAGMLTAPVPLAQPKPVLHIGGREDRRNDFREQVASVQLAREANHAPAMGASCGQDCLVYTQGAAAPVMTVYHAGGHIYPVNATSRIVAFFRDFVRR